MEKIPNEKSFRRYLTHDIHTHTHLSLCCSAPGIPDTYIRNAEERGISVLGFSDHMWDSSIPLPAKSEFYEIQDFAHICEIKKEISYHTDKVKVLFGAESEFCGAELLGISREVAEQLDFLLVPHSHTHMLDFVMPRELDNNIPLHADYLVRSFLALCAHPLHDLITSIAHPFLPVCKSIEYKNRIFDAISDEQFAECFDAAKDAGIGIEINPARYFGAKCTPEQVANDGYMRVLSIAKARGCRFSLGSDAHGLKNLDAIELAAVILEKLNITDRDFIDLVK